MPSTSAADTSLGTNFNITGLGIPTALQQFPPTFEAALRRAGSISPSQYARSRNALVRQHASLET